MCDAIEYLRDGEPVVVYFDGSRAELPIRKRSGAVEFITWGARGERYLCNDNTPGYLLKFPLGGRAPRESVLAGTWEKFEPRPVRIIASRFVLMHAQLGPLFFALKRGEYIQGLLAQTTVQRRVYVVTVAAPAEHADQWQEWPRIIKSRPAPCA